MDTSTSQFPVYMLQLLPLVSHFHSLVTQASHVAKLGEITGKTRVLYLELGEITGKTCQVGSLQISSLTLGMLFFLILNDNGEPSYL